MYNFINFSGVSLYPFKFLWKSNSPPRAKFLMWLIIHKKLNIVELLKKKNIIFDVKCCFCSPLDEDVNHLFFSCNFTNYILNRVFGIFFSLQKRRFVIR